MNKKITAFVTIFAFILFTVSCVSYSPKKTELEKAVADSQKGKIVEILGVIKKSGVRIDYPKKNPGRIVGDRIVATGLLAEIKVPTELDKKDIQETRKDSRNRVIGLKTWDGTRYYVAKNSYVDQGGKVKFLSIVEERMPDIPLDEVELVWIRKFDAGKTFLIVAGGIVLTGLIISALVALLKESCPFIYSFDGEQYIFDAEPYGGAICEGMQRTEWCGLEYLEEADGFYKMMVTNEVNETQYTDEIGLVVADHPKGTQVVADEAGVLHTISKPIVPVAADDEEDRSLLFYVGENDWVFWKTPMDEEGLANRENLKHEIVFQFPKPEDAEEAKLLFNGCSTLWASQMIKQFLELHGSEVGAYYDRIAARGPASQRLAAWNLREELYRMHIRVETEHGWKSKGLLVGGGPFVSEDRVYTIDLRDVPGDVLRIKLTPPLGFWQIDYVAVDYSEDLPVEEAVELEPFEAYDSKGDDMREVLAHADGRYMVMPEIGDQAVVKFLAVPERAGMERSYILKASGYYDIHLDGKGDGKRSSRTDILDRIMDEPGFTVRYAIQKYLEWQKKN